MMSPLDSFTEVSHIDNPDNRIQRLPARVWEHETFSSCLSPQRSPQLD